MSLASPRHPGHARARGRPAGRLAACLLVLLLLWAGTWAAWHRVAHAGHAGASGLARSWAPLAERALAPALGGTKPGGAHDAAAHAAGGHRGGHAPGGLDCQALDHGLGADTPPLSPPVWPVLAAASLLPQPPEPHRVLLRPRWAQPARAPPVA